MDRGLGCLSMHVQCSQGALSRVPAPSRHSTTGEMFDWKGREPDGVTGVFIAVAKLQQNLDGTVTVS